jgi:CHAT domain-containing protein
MQKCGDWKDKSCLYDAYYYRGYFLQKTGKIKDCIPFFESAIRTDRILSGGVPSEEAGDCYQLLGHAYAMLADKFEALQQYEKSRFEYQESVGGKSRKFTASMLILSGIYARENRFDNAIPLARQVVELRKQLPEVKKSYIFSAYLNLVSIFMSSGHIDSCRLYLDEARHYLIQDETRNVTGWKNYFDCLSNVSFLSGETESALVALDSALAIAEKQGGFNTREAGKFLTRKSEFLIAAGEYQAALELAHEALQRILPDLQQMPLSENPGKKMLNEEPWLQTAFTAKASAWQKMSNDKTGTEKVQYLEKAIEAFRLGCDVVDNMRSSFVSGESGIDLSSLTYSQYENGIECSLQLYNLTKDKRYLNSAWDFMERSKATALLTQLSGMMASELILPDSVKAMEQLLNDSIAWYVGRQASAKGSEYNRLHGILLKKEEAKRDFVERLELSNPAYFQFKYDLALAPVDTLQAYLGKKESQLLEYFVGDSNVYIMSVTPAEVKLMQVPRHGQWEKSLVYYCNGISGIEEFATVSEPLEKSGQLFTELVKPLLSPQTKHLFVVPDGGLWSLPFEALVTGPATSFADAPFLLHEFPIQYAWSGNFLLKMPHLKLNGNQQLLAYAPSFGTDENEGLNRKFGKLTHNTIEARAISGLTGGQLRLTEKATEKSFRKEAPLYSVLHVASHAMMRKGSPDSTGIVFQQRSGYFPPEDDGFLSINEMGNLRLNAELAVLSACETGDGQLVRGEGLMSLARSFTNTGCRSLVMSLWKVDDEATSVIMKHFYENLGKGMEKDVALQQAKISYLSEGNPHPADWAAFVGIGSPDAVKIKSSSGVVLWLVLSGIAFIVILGAGALSSKKL